MWRTICHHWFAATPEAIRPIASSGWSGAPVHAVTAAGREYILKRFTEGTTRRRAEWVHALMDHCRAACPAIVPEVVRGRDGSALHEDAAGGLWELVECRPGAPCDDPMPALVSVLMLSVGNAGILLIANLLREQEQPNP